MITEIIMPKQGLQMTEGYITKWFVHEGDAVKEGEPLFEMETDKLSITIDASASGVMKSILYPEGSTVPITTVIAVIGDAGDTYEKKAQPKAETETVQLPKTEPLPTPQPKVQPAPSVKPGRVFSTPRARMFAEDKGISVSDIRGTGPDGLIIAADVLSAQKKPAYAIIVYASVTEEYGTYEDIIKLAYMKAADKAGIESSFAAVKCRVNRSFSYMTRPESEGTVAIYAADKPDVILCAIYITDEDEDKADKFADLFKLFAEKPYMAVL